MKAFIAVVLVALFAVAASQYDEEADFPIFLAATLASQLLRRKRDSVMADQNNFNFGANVNNGQWGVNGQYQRTWNGGNTNLGVQGQWQQGQGYNAGVNFSHRWDDVEESDAQFFKDWMKKAGSWLKNPENLQKAVEVYKIVRSDDEEEDEESDIAWLPIISLAAQYGPKVYDMIKNRRDEAEADFRLPSWVNMENAQKAINFYNMLRRDESDDEESDIAWLPIISLAAQYGPKVYDYIKNRRDEAEADFPWATVGSLAMQYGPKIYDYIRNRRDQAESDYIYGYKCINLGSAIGYSGSYDQCRQSCNATAKYSFVNGVASSVSYFPRAMFSSGGCSCCGNTM